MPREPWDFVEQAFKADHPRSISLHLNSESTEMLKENFAMPPHLVVKARVEFFVKWSARCKALEVDEKKLHDGLEPHLKQVLQGKRLLLFQEMLDSLGYPDQDLVRDIVAGFPLSGWLPKSHVFPVGLTRALKQQRKWQRVQTTTSAAKLRTRWTKA